MTEQDGSEQGSNEQEISELELSRRMDEQREYMLAELRAEAELGARIRQQVSYIREEFGKVGIEIGVFPAGRGVGFMYAESQILVREEYLQRVWDILLGIMNEPGKYQLGEPDVPRDDPDEPQLAGPDESQPAGPDESQPAGPGEATGDDSCRCQPHKPFGYRPVTAGVVLLQLPRPDLGVPDVLDVIDKLLGEGVATPNHVLTVAPEVGPCPATEPEMVDDHIEPSPGICTGNSGAVVRIYIADTGLLDGAAAKHSWLHGVRRGRKPDGELQPWETALDADSLIPPYAGHGTFVAGVARCMAPQAEIVVSNVFRIAGSALESHFVRELTRALKLGADLFHLSITAPTRGDLPLLAFERWLKLLGQYKGVACVVAAGNNGSSHPFWPAAFSEVVSVGALAADGRDRASFSNYGGWVDVYAPGRDLVNAYATGTYECRVKPYKGNLRVFNGMARWSGTSFSTPVVTGLIADRMSRTGENGKEAAAALLAAARSQAIPGVGAVLLPCGDTGSVGPACPAECCCTHRCRPGDC